MKPKAIGIGEEYRTSAYIGDSQAKEFGVQVDFEFVLECSAKSVKTRDMLADKTVMYLWWVTRMYLEEGGLIVTEVSCNAQEEKEDDSKPIFIKKVTLKVWSEWTEFVSYDTVTGIGVTLREIKSIRRTHNLDMNSAIDLWVKNFNDDEK
jgi:hypothetical protein